MGLYRPVVLKEAIRLIEETISRKSAAGIPAASSE